MRHTQSRNRIIDAGYLDFVLYIWVKLLSCHVQHMAHDHSRQGVDLLAVGEGCLVMDQANCDNHVLFPQICPLSAPTQVCSPPPASCGSSSGCGTDPAASARASDCRCVGYRYSD